MHRLSTNSTRVRGAWKIDKDLTGGGTLGMFQWIYVPKGPHGCHCTPFVCFCLQVVAMLSRIVHDAFDEALEML
jgi:hypothetical protein